MAPRMEAGQFVRFTYNPPARHVPTPKARPVQSKDPKTGALTTTMVAPKPIIQPPTDRSKEVFILNPSFGGLVHAIDMKGLTPAEQQVLHAIMDPENKAKVDAGQWPIDGVPNYPLVRDVLKRLAPTEMIKNPLSFYSSFVKPFIRGKDVYRKYNSSYMFSLQVIQESKVVGHVTNPAPLFKKL